MKITVNSKPQCVQCRATYRALDARGADYSVTDMSENAEALAAAKELGYLQAPVTIVRDSDDTIIDHWGGFNPEKIEKYAAAQAEQLALV